MADNEATQGNPEIGMQGDSLESMRNDNSGSSADFFSRLENSVNGGIMDTPEATQNQTSGPQEVTHDLNGAGSAENVMQSNSSVDYEKRYKDSSREAGKWREKYKQLEQFVPVLEAMKNDSGLVDHVRNYLKNGGAPAQSVQEQLNLDEDFVFDQTEAMTDPNSDSAKVMNAHVDGLVQQRVNSMVEQEQKRAVELQQKKALENQESEFKTKMNMSEDEFVAFKNKAKTHKMTLDDIHLIINKDQAQANVAQNAKQDMLNQMKNVQNMPTSASGANSQGQAVSEERDVFNSILGNDNSVDNLFG